MKAVIIGATGAVGHDLLEQLLASEQYERVDAFVRRPLSLQHEKLCVHVIDFEKPEMWRKDVQGDVLFSCLGTTLKQAGGQKPQWRVDHDYQLEFARAAAENGVGEYALVSSMGANARSMNFYMRMKGTLEDAVKALPFRHITIVQPPSLIRKNSDRWAETASVRILQALNKIGILRSVAPMPTEEVAACMLRHVGNGKTGLEVITKFEVENGVIGSVQFARALKSML